MGRIWQTSCFVFQTGGRESPSLLYPPPSGSPGSVTPVLHEAQIARLAQAASELAANLPPFEPRSNSLNNKRKMPKEIEVCNEQKSGDTDNLFVYVISF